MPEFIPTVTMSIKQYEIILEYKNKYEWLLEEMNSLLLDYQVMEERWKESMKMLEEKQAEVTRLKAFEDWYGDKYHAD